MSRTGLVGVWMTCRDYLKSMEAIRDSRSLKLATVFLALFLDNILLTVVVPIIPDYLMLLDSENRPGHSQLNGDREVTSASPVTFWNWSDVTSAYNWTGTDRFDGESYGDENIRIVYIFGESYVVLFLARSVQGVGSSCTAIAGMAMLAEIYPEDKERSKAMGIALGGLALGVLVGYPFGGVMYQFVGKVQLFLVIGALLLLEGVMQIWTLRPSWKVQEMPQGTPLSVLLRDPYILIASGAIMFTEMTIAMLEPTLPIWLIENVHPEKWQLGVVFLPDSVGYWIGCNIFGVLSVKLGRWRVAMVGVFVTGVCLFCIPQATKIVHLLVPHFCIGISLGMVDAAMMPLLALLVDTRHVTIYGSVYAIAEVAISLGFAIGPSVGGQMVKCVGFPWLIRGIAIVNILYTPLCYFLKNPPARGDTSGLMSRDDETTYGTTETETFSYRRLK